MNTIFLIIQKELRQVFRNKTMIPIIFVIPIVQLIVLVHAASLEMKNINLYVVDNDISSYSRQLVQKIKSSTFFNITGTSFSKEEAINQLIADKADLVLVIPNGFERNLTRETGTTIQILINAINGTKAGIGNVYCQSIIQNFNQDIVLNQFKIDSKTQAQLQEKLNITYSYWYNPQLNYKTYMVPGILVLLVTIIGMFLSSMNLVREKEMGTIEQINVTPIKKYQFIIGKLFPFWIIALFELAFGLTLGKLLFDIPIVGSVGLVFLTASIYLLVVLALGLFVSTITDTQQQAMFISWFFALIFILMSGLFTSVDSMPDWAQKLNFFNPIAYFIKIIRMILLKGSEFRHILKDIIVLFTFAVALLGMAVWRYRKTS